MTNYENLKNLYNDYSNKNQIKKTLICHQKYLVVRNFWNMLYMTETNVFEKNDNHEHTCFYIRT